MTHVLVALIPKPGAQHEGQLRPIGILPMLYRIYMKIRRQSYQSWTREIHHGREESALDLAWKTRVQDEIDESNGLYTITSFLDCSKCYERVNHRVAQDLLLGADAPPSLVNMILSMYQGDRYIKVHGQTIHAGKFHQGIIAGCSWAKDILKVLIADIKSSCADLGITLRDYVDDMMLRETSHDIQTLIHCAYTGLQYAKQLIRAAGLKDNEAKEQILITNKKVSDAFKAAYPDAAGKVVQTAKDLGVCQRRHTHCNPVIAQRIKDKIAYAS